MLFLETFEEKTIVQERDSNPWPSRFKRDVLPTELNQPGHNVLRRTLTIILLSSNPAVFVLSVWVYFHSLLYVLEVSSKILFLHRHTAQEFRYHSTTSLTDGTRLIVLCFFSKQLKRKISFMSGIQTRDLHVSFVALYQLSLTQIYISSHLFGSPRIRMRDHVLFADWDLNRDSLL